VINQADQLNFKDIGHDVTIFPLAKIVYPEVISIGNSVIVDDFVLIMGGEETTIGSFVHIASYASLVGGGVCIVEDFVGISGGARVYTGNDDYLGGSLTGPTVPDKYRNAIRSFVHFEKHSLVGANSVILPGVTIHEGAAIGAGSVVTKDCEAWTIYAGAPARPIKARRSDIIPNLERQLRAEAYDEKGRYVPKDKRTPG
jgi:galactoside O-acetyltransferase